MVTTNQVYGIVNDAASEALGEKAIAVKATASFVSVGDVVLSSDTNKDQFYKSLANRIGSTGIAGRAYAKRKDL